MYFFEMKQMYVYVPVNSKTLECIKTFNTNYKDSSWDQNSIFKLNILILTAKIPVKIKTQYVFKLNVLILTAKIPVKIKT